MIGDSASPLLGWALFVGFENMFRDWRNNFVKIALADLFGAAPRSFTLRQFLVQIYAGLSSAPEQVDNFAELFEETEIERQKRGWVDKIHAGKASPQYLEHLAAREFALAVLGLARALDDILAHERVHRGLLSISDVLSADEKFYVIPRLRPRAASSLKQNQGLRRRLLVYHHMIPTSIKGSNVVLYNLGVLRDASSEPNALVGAAMFANSELKIAKNASGAFRATGVEMANAEDIIRGQVDACLTAGCFAAVWPELTLPPDWRTWVASAFANEDYSITPRKRPQIVVAGTWHEQRGSHHYNVATILSGSGKLLGEYRKMVPFTSRPTGAEDIELGDEFPVFLTEQYLASIAICKDFSKKSREELIEQLDVDVMLVPSLANKTTFRSHRETAMRLKITADIRSFVVQQADKPSRGVLGNVLPMMRDPRNNTVTKQQKRVWETYKGEVG